MTDNPILSTAWSPPAGYVQVDSTVAGILVYAPAPAGETAAQGPVSFHCPSCGAATRYDVAAGGVACEYCGFSAKAAAETVGEGAAQNEFTLEALNRAAKGWGEDRQELACDSCGAVLALAPKSLTATCPFCASNRVNVRRAAAEQLQPKFVIPFQKTTADIRASAAAWLGKGWFHPGELAKSAVIDRFTGIYLPFWTFSAAVHSHWKAEVGYEREERYYDSSEKEWKTRTVIDWRWEDGDVTTRETDLLISGSSHISRVILERVYPFRLSDLATYAPDFLAGWQAHQYDIPLTTAWEAGKTAIREKARADCYTDIPTSHVRSFSMSADFDDETWRYVLLPVYLAAYRFEQKVFQVMVNGQTGLVAGQKPVAWWKVWLAVAALLTPGLAVCLIGLPLLLFGGAGAVFLIVGLAILLAGGAFALPIYRQAVASEAS